jgi:hypothetical protein
MRKVTIVRLGVAAALAMMGTAGALGSGCTSSSATSDGGLTGQDSGPTGTTGDGGTGTQDGSTGTSDSSTDGPAPDTYVPPPANLVLAHTSPGIPPFRVCFSEGAVGTTASVPALPALPDGPGAAPAYPTTGPYPGVAAGTPGVYPGTIGAFPSLGLSLENLQVTPYAVLASSIANDVNLDGGAGINASDGGAEEDCVHLIGTHGLGTTDPGTPGRLTLNQDFFALPTIPASTLKDTQTFLLTINGCLPGGTAGYEAGVPENVTCGPAYDGGNTASIGIIQLDTTTVPDGGIGVQFAHRSTAVENTPVEVAVGDTAVLLHTAASDGVWPAFFQVIPDAGDDGAAGVVPTTLTTSPVLYSDTGLTATQTVSVNLTAATTAFGVFVQPLDGGAPNALAWPGTVGAGGAVPGDVIALPLSDIQLLSSWSSTTADGGAPATFTNGTSWVFIFEGDPAAQQLVTPAGAQNPSYDGRGVHIVAFPNTFTAKSQ